MKLKLLLAAPVAASALTPAGPCKDKPGAGSVWCDHTKDLETRTAAIVNALTDDEKAGLFVSSPLNLYSTFFTRIQPFLHVSTYFLPPTTLP